MTSRGRRIVKLGLLIAIAVPTALAFRLCVQFLRGGIEVCVRNVDSQPLRSGEIASRSSETTKLYAIKDLAPNESTCVRVMPEGESSIDVTFRTSTGKTRPIPLEGYVEQDNRGSISADVTANGTTALERDIRFGL